MSERLPLFGPATEAAMSESRHRCHPHPAQTYCTDHGHAYRSQCWAAQGLGCRNGCGWAHK